MEYLNAFWVGGLICALTQILMEKTKMLPGRIMVLLVCGGAVLGSQGQAQACHCLGLGTRFGKESKKRWTPKGF